METRVVRSASHSVEFAVRRTALEAVDCGALALASSIGFDRFIVCQHEAAHLVIGVKLTDANLTCTVRSLDSSGHQWQGNGYLGIGSLPGRLTTMLAGYRYEYDLGIDGAPQHVGEIPNGTDLHGAKTSAAAEGGAQDERLAEGWAAAGKAIESYAHLIQCVAERLCQLADGVEVDRASVEAWIDECES